MTFKVGQIVKVTPFMEPTYEGYGGVGETFEVRVVGECPEYEDGRVAFFGTLNDPNHEEEYLYFSTDYDNLELKE